MVELTPAKKARLFTLMEQGVKPRDAAAKIGCDPSTARRNFAKLQKNPDFKAKPHRPGRPRKVDQRGLHQAERSLKKGECRDAADVKRTFFPEVGESTVRRNLAEIGLHGRIRWAKPPPGVVTVDLLRK
ncbi:hypothetical protein FKP32DRAFT_1671488 [Trametes sanguinea]|nr:hypothetical protein FKP32DRAFT_1671488 [Trametes sanguinea]